jgi:hypothetical protein
MTSVLEVDADAVRGCASALADTAAEVAAGTTAPPAVTVPRWTTTAAAESLTDATQRFLATLAVDLEAFRHAVLAAVADYEAADHRAADRLGGAG